MQAPLAIPYDRLARLAQSCQRRRPHQPGAAHNPRLGVDLLCFQHYQGALIGVLVTPQALSLARIATRPGEDAAGEGECCLVALPSGRYVFRAERLDDEVLWQCELIDDLSGVSGPMEASQLAQRVMDRAMAPEEDTGAGT